MTNNHITNFTNEKRLSSSSLTISQYTYTLNVFASYVNKPLDTVTRTDIISYLNHLLYERKLSQSTVATIDSTLKSFYAFMESTLHVSNPTKDVPRIKIDKRAPTYLTKSEAATLIGCATNTSDDLLFRVAYDAGVRVSELVNIRKRDIDFASSTIRVFGKGAKERVVLVTPELASKLDTYAKDMSNDDLIFNVSSRTVQRHIKVLAANAGIDKHVTPHKVRHSMATHFVQNGGNVVALKSLLGHESLNTTQIYTHYSVNELREAYNRVHGGV